MNHCINIAIALSFFLFAEPILAQRVLEIEEISNTNIGIFADIDPDIRNAGGKQGGITVYCSSHIPLQFTEMESEIPVKPYSTEEKDGLTYYYIRFIIGRYKGTSYENRIVTITSPGFIPIRTKLDLQPNESKLFKVSDPNATVGVGCFRENYNKGMELFRNSAYKEAQDLFTLSLQCTDAENIAQVQEKIANIDSMLLFRKQGDDSFREGRYLDAYTNYRKIFSYNFEDQYAKNQAIEAQTLFYSNCTTYYEKAERHFAAGEYLDAKKYYEIVVNQSCTNTLDATLRLKEVNGIIEGRKQRAQTILYEYADNTPIGISVGTYKERKVGGYFSLRLNTDVFESIRNNYEQAKLPELDASFGWTLMVYKPAWIFWGVGYTGMGEWEYDRDKPSDDPSLKIHSAVTPELGALVKVGPIVLRYTFEYRFALEKDFQDFMGKTKHVAGIGVCF